MFCTEGSVVQRPASLFFYLASFSLRYCVLGMVPAS